jgi:uncharacterized iron-regulated membrane protein
MTRAKQIAWKVAVVFGGAVMLASAFVMSLVFFVIALAVVLAFGGYLWWKTRELRRQLRARVQEQRWQQSGGQIIEGEVISAERNRH